MDLQCKPCYKLCPQYNELKLARQTQIGLFVDVAQDLSCVPIRHECRVTGVDAPATTLFFIIR